MNGVKKKLVLFAVLCFCLYMFYTLIRYQISISSKQQELESLNSQLSAQLAENAELQRSLDDGEDAIMERAAREEGYVSPSERVFVDISGK